MTVDAGLGDVVQFVSFFVTPTLGVAAYYLKGLRDEVRDVGKSTGEVRDELRKLNGRLVRLEAWRDLHSRQCEERATQTHEDIVELRRAVGN